MKYILVSKSDTMIVDDSFGWLSDMKWHLKNGYAETSFVIPGGRGVALAHQLIIDEPPEGLIIDHINRNRLDNRLENLRLVDRSVNRRNAKLNKNNIVGHRGVQKRNGRFRSYIVLNSRNTHLGTYDTLEEAIKVRIAKEKEYGIFFHE